MERSEVALSEVLGALSYALDITEGEPPGHAVRTTVIGALHAAVADPGWTASLAAPAAAARPRPGSLRT